MACFADSIQEEHVFVLTIIGAVQSLSMVKVTRRRNFCVTLVEFYLMKNGEKDGQIMKRKKYLRSVASTSGWISWLLFR